MLLAVEALAVWLAIVLVTMLLVAYLATRWGRDPFGWLLLSAAMGPIALIAIIGTRQSDVGRATLAGADTRIRRANGRRVILATDGSAASTAVARHAAELPGAVAEVLVLAVLPHEAEPRRPDAPDREYDERVRNATQSALDVLHQASISARVVVAFGAPGEEIVHFAERESADLIVVGRRGAGLTRALLGSTSDYVVKNAVCAVTVIG